MVTMPWFAAVKVIESGDTTLREMCGKKLGVEAISKGIPLSRTWMQ